MCGKAAGHVRIARGQAPIETAPALAAIVAAHNLRMSAAGLLRSVAAKADRVIWSRADGAVSFPRRGPILSRPEKDSVRRVGMDYCWNGIGSPHSILRLRPIFAVVSRDVGADAGSRIQDVALGRMTDDQVNVTVNPPVFVFAHLVGENARRIIILGISCGAGWAADILPTFSSISAARHPALFDADEDFVRHAGVQGDAANVSGVWWWRKGPLVVFRQLAECRQLAKRATAVFAHIDGGGQRTDVELVSTGGMNLHRPDIA